MTKTDDHPMIRSALLVTVALALSAPALGAELPFCDVPSAASLFNPKGDPAARQAELARVTASAMTRSGKSYERWQLGALYRLGGEHPAGLLVRDTTQARRFLSTAAMGGELAAMPGLAEIELAAGEPMKAMVWAQAWVHFTRAAGSEPAASQYLADLLRRVYDELGRSPAIDQEIEEYLAGFVAMATPKIEAAQAALAAEVPTCRWTTDAYPAHVLPVDHRRVAASRAQRDLGAPGFATFLLTVDPAGNVVDAWVVDSLPDAGAGRGLDATVRRLKFNAIDSTAPQRRVMVPVSYNDGSTQLREP
jgi:hypothetical protein